MRDCRPGYIPPAAARILLRVMIHEKTERYRLFSLDPAGRNRGGSVGMDHAEQHRAPFGTGHRTAPVPSGPCVFPAVAPVFGPDGHRGRPGLAGSLRRIPLPRARFFPAPAGADSLLVPSLLRISGLWPVFFVAAPAVE